MLSMIPSLFRQRGAVRHLAAAVRYAQSAATRDSRFAELTPDDVSRFKAILGETGVITDKDTLESYNEDWMKRYHGHSSIVLRPKTTTQVSEVLKHCNERRLAVVPQGGNTGLVGGSVPLFDEVVLSTTAMNEIISFDKVSGALVSQAGCVLQTLDDYVAERGFIMPLDLGAKGSCQIGGNVSTNAGGLRLLRYGSLHGTVLGVEVVLADGRVMDLLRTLRKDNTGYDLKQLFIGAEGTLGVVTAVAVQCAPRPSSVQLAFLSVESYESVQKVLAVARSMLGEVLSAVEFLDAECMRLAEQYLAGVSDPLGTEGRPAGGPSPFYMLIETHGSRAGHDGEKLEDFLEEVMTQGLVTNGTVSQSDAQTAAIWHVREGITEALSRRGYQFKYDLSMPVSEMYSLVEEVRSRLAHIPNARVVGYGHVGDGNLHLNISVEQYSEIVLNVLEPFVYEWTTARRGSISAEHGLGQFKAEQVGYSKSEEAITLMADIKALMDPKGILNPYKVLPARAKDKAYNRG